MQIPRIISGNLNGRKWGGVQERSDGMTQTNVLLLQNLHYMNFQNIKTHTPVHVIKTCKISQAALNCLFLHILKLFSYHFLRRNHFSVIFLFCKVHVCPASMGEKVKWINEGDQSPDMVGDSPIEVA